MLGCTATKGDNGNPGAPGDPGAASIAVISPASGVLDRELDVAIAGTATAFDSSTTVSFGAGTTVTSVAVVSSADVVARVRVDKAAAIGSRDVIVTSGGTTLTATAAFTIRPAIEVTARAGNQQQASLSVIDVHDNDAPFDSTSFVLGTPLFRIAGDAMTVDPISTTIAEATALVLVDPLAPPTSQLVGENLDPLDGVTPMTTFLSDPSQLPIAAATPTKLTATVLDPVIQPLQTFYYTLSTSGPAIVSFTITGSGGIVPAAWTFPASGANADLLTRSTTNITLPTATATTFYLVTADSAFDVFVPRVAVTALGVITSFSIVTAQLNSEVAIAHSTVGTAQALAPTNASGPLVVAGTLSAPGEVDVYQIGSLGTSASGANVVLTMTAGGDFEAFVSDASLTPPIIGAFEVSPRLPEHTASASAPTNTTGQFYLVVRARSGARASTGAYTVSLAPTT
jgi:hypothetical protein